MLFILKLRRLRSNDTSQLCIPGERHLHYPEVLAIPIATLPIQPTCGRVLHMALYAIPRALAKLFIAPILATYLGTS